MSVKKIESLEIKFKEYFTKKEYTTYYSKSLRRRTRAEKHALENIYNEPHKTAKNALQDGEADILNNNPFYIDAECKITGHKEIYFKIQIPSIYVKRHYWGSYDAVYDVVDTSHFKFDYLVSPTEEYITRYKKGQEVETVPLRIFTGTKSIYDYFLHGNNVYKCSRVYTDEELKLLIMDLEDKERRKFERLKHKLSLAQEETSRRRERIPEKVRIAVWRRDEGKCAECGSKENLEYDHIIPVSKGGSNTERNIQLLCEQCNRKKSGKIM